MTRNTVIIGGRRTELLQRIAAEHPGIDTVQIDTADAASVRSAGSQVLARHPDLNVIIAMAGIMKIEDWHHPETFLESAESIITTNVLGGPSASSRRSSNTCKSSQTPP